MPVLNRMCRHSCTCDLQYCNEEAAGSMPWAGGFVSALVHGGLGSFRFAHAEAVAQEAAGRSSAAGNADFDPTAPQKARLMGASTLEGISRGMTPPVARALASRGLIRPLLQVGSPASPVTTCVRLRSAFQRWQMSLPRASAIRKRCHPRYTRYLAYALTSYGKFYCKHIAGPHGALQM